MWTADCLNFWDQNQQFGVMREVWFGIDSHDGRFFVTATYTITDQPTYPHAPHLRQLMEYGFFETTTPVNPITGQTICIQEPGRNPDCTAPGQKAFNHYGQRLRGLFRPLRTGVYHFWLAADDLAEVC